MLRLCLLLLASTLPALGQSDWRQTLRERLPLLGHRNWIVIADSAYPLQTAPGILTVDTGSDHLDVVRAVLDALGQTKHVQPTIYTDAELKYVAEKNAQGITAYRDALNPFLGSRPVQVLPHEQIIAKLDEAGKTFSVLLLKTKLTLPYTSVFIQLECGYWTANAEAELRAAMKAPARGR